MSNLKPLPLLQVNQIRGGQLESNHGVHAVWVDYEGKVVKYWGNPNRLICPRSTLKPLQALLFLQTKAYLKAPDQDKSIALASASHLAEERHIKYLQKWLKELNLKDTDVKCGIEKPKDFDRIKEMVKKGEQLTTLFNNCSGKHVGVLAACHRLNLPQDKYYEYSHPAQIMIRQIASNFTGYDWDELKYCLDGCGMVNYYLPLVDMARAMSKFLVPKMSRYEEELTLFQTAAKNEPYMLGGEGELASEIIKITNGRLITKIGAQGNFMALDYNQKQVLYLKVEDGSEDIANNALVELLKHHKAISSSEYEKISKFSKKDIKNHAGTKVGEILVVF
jgi:L-asparaginase II